MSNETRIATQPELAERPLPRFLSLVSEHATRIDPRLKPLAELALADAQQRLNPSSKIDFRNQLTACLTLVAPSGMSEADRNEWLRAAWLTLDGIPPDLLDRGCAVARRQCDHPSKIVPTVLREVEAIWTQRKNARSSVTAAIAKMRDPEDSEPRCTPEEAKAIREKLGIMFTEDAPVRTHRGPPQKPTREDYIRWGVPEEDLPPMPPEPLEDAA